MNDLTIIQTSQVIIVTSFKLKIVSGKLAILCGIVFMESDSLIEYLSVVNFQICVSFS